MTTSASSSVRASDAEREEIARIVTAAGSDGRLTLAETEERLGLVYAARFRADLNALTTDLPQPPTRARPAPRVPSLRVHAVVVLVLAVLIIGRWVASGAGFFWPLFPLFWLTMSVVVHARLRRRRAGG